MAILKANIPEFYSTCYQNVEKSANTMKDAESKTTSTNGQFTTKAGRWAIAEQAVGQSHEADVRAITLGMENLKFQTLVIYNKLDGEMRSSRDAVFSAVGASSAKPDWVCFDTNDYTNANLDAQTKTDDVFQKAHDVINACAALENSGGITAALYALGNDCNTCKDKIIDQHGKFLTYVGKVGDFNNQGSNFDPAKFVTEDMVISAASEAYKNDYDGAKKAIKTIKSYFSNIGEAEKIFASQLKAYDPNASFAKNLWSMTIDGVVPGKPAKHGGKWSKIPERYYAEFHKKLGESTMGLSNADDFVETVNGEKVVTTNGNAFQRIYSSLKDNGVKQSLKDFPGGAKQYAKDMGKRIGRQLSSNNGDIAKALDTFFGSGRGDTWNAMKSGAGDLADGAEMLSKTSFAKTGWKYAANKTVEGLKKVPWEKAGKGLKAAGRYLGYAGDAITIGEAAFKSTKAFQSGDWKQGLGQIAKGAVKIGVGKAVGAAIGSIGGPLGFVGGMVVGGLIDSAVSGLIDEGFKQVGVY